LAAVFRVGNNSLAYAPKVADGIASRRFAATAIEPSVVR
jgi:hypothetical protein